MRAPILAAFLAAALSACGSADAPSLAPAASSCPAGLAQIEVGDAYLRVLCGCAEAAGTIVAPPATLTCTVPSAATQVHFRYLTAVSRHQIVPLAPASPLTPSPVYDPESAAPVRTHSVILGSSGTYPFRDAFHGGLQGQIVVP